MSKTEVMIDIKELYTVITNDVTWLEFLCNEFKEQLGHSNYMQLSKIISNRKKFRDELWTIL